MYIKHDSQLFLNFPSPRHHTIYVVLVNAILHKTEGINHDKIRVVKGQGHTCFARLYPR
jgi:hypothetical protein